MGAENEVPTNNLMIQNKQIICQPYIDKSVKAAPPIVIGKLNLHENMQGIVEEDPLFTNDPWAKYRPGMEASGPSQPRKQRPITKGDSNMQVEDSDNTNDVVARQSARIAVMEDQLKNLHDQMAADQKSNQQRFTQLDQNISSVASGLRGTLEAALKQQSESLIATFDTLLNRSPRNTTQIPQGNQDREVRSRSPVREK